MKTPIVSVTLLLLLLVSNSFAQKVDAAKPLPENADLKVTTKWLLEAMKDNLIYYIPRDKKDETRFRIRDLKFEDCLFSYSIYRDDHAASPPPVIPPEATRPPDIGPDGSDRSGPMKIPTPNTSNNKGGKQFIDFISLDLREAAPESLRVIGYTYQDRIANLMALDRSMMAKNPAIGPPDGKPMMKVTSKPSPVSASKVATPRVGVVFTIKAESVDLIKSGLTHAIKLCQVP